MGTLLTTISSYWEYLDYASELSSWNGIPLTIASHSSLLPGKDFLNGKQVRGQLSFTPYIYNECSARCRFCSERLNRPRKSCTTDMIHAEDYTVKLEHILRVLSDNRLFLSISGMEPLESPEFLEQVLKTFSRFEGMGGQITEKVIYTNLSAAAREPGTVAQLLQKYHISRIETSRHHYDDEVNNRIMRFRSDQPVAGNDYYRSAVEGISNLLPVKLACVLQKEGIGSVTDVERYIDWAAAMGVRDITFRELSILGEHFNGGATYKYIRNNRQSIFLLMEELPAAFCLTEIVKGYYYFSFRYLYNNHVSVSFEVSDYEEMIRHHNSDVINKLIYYPNGDLCMDWNMQNKIY